MSTCSMSTCEPHQLNVASSGTFKAYRKTSYSRCGSNRFALWQCVLWPSKLMHQQIGFHRMWDIPYVSKFSLHAHDIQWNMHDDVAFCDVHIHLSCRYRNLDLFAKAWMSTPHGCWRLKQFGCPYSDMRWCRKLLNFEKLGSVQMCWTVFNVCCCEGSRWYELRHDDDLEYRHGCCMFQDTRRPLCHHGCSSGDLWSWGAYGLGKRMSCSVVMNCHSSDRLSDYSQCNLSIEDATQPAHTLAHTHTHPQTHMGDMLHHQWVAHLLRAETTHYNANWR